MVHLRMIIPQAASQVYSVIVVKEGLKSSSLNLSVHCGCMQDLRDVCVSGMFFHFGID